MLVNGPVGWKCEGCGWEIALPLGSLPPLEHSLEMNSVYDTPVICPKVWWYRTERKVKK